MLDRVVDRYDPGYTTDDLLASVESQRMQLWVCVDNRIITACVVSEIQEYPRYRVFNLIAMAGDGMDKWFTPAFDVLEAYGKHHGCKYLSGSGRKGWVRQCRNRGYNEAFVVTRKELI